MFVNYSLRTRMIIAFLAVALLSLGPLALLNTRTTRAMLTDEANQALLAAASQTAAGLDALISDNLDAIRTGAMLPNVVKYLSLPPDQRPGSAEEAKVADTLIDLTNKNLFYISSYALLDHQGRNVVDTLQSDIGQDESDRDYFQAPLRTGLPYVSPVEFAQTTGGVYLYFSSPVRNEARQTVGVLRARYSVGGLQEMVSESQGLAGEGSFATLLDENHVILAHDTAPELMFKTVVPLGPARVAELRAAGRLPNLLAEELSTNLPALEQGLNNATDQPFFVADAHAGGTCLEQMAVVAVETQPWFVVYAQPQEVFLAPIDDAIRATLMLAAIIAGLVVVAAVVMAQWLASPITRLTAVAEQITAGDLTAQARVEPGNEIGRLALTFNSMTARLRQTLEGLEQRNQQLHLEIAERQRAEGQLQRYAAELEEANAELSQYAYVVSHDLKTPLRAVHNYADFLREDLEATLDGDQKVYLDGLGHAVQEAEELVEDLLELSRIGRRGIPIETVDVGVFLRKLLAILSLPADVEIVMADDWLTMEVEPVLLGQIFQNLISNAIKFNASPRKHVELGWQPVTPDLTGFPKPVRSQWYEFFVRDNGIGIDPRYHEQIFRVFERLHTSEGYEGTGVGLAIVKKATSKLSGSVRVKSIPGEGEHVLRDPAKRETLCVVCIWNT